jgi:hypothetical protein
MSLAMGNTHQPPSKVEEYLQSLIKSERPGAQVVYQTVLPEKPALWSHKKAQWSRRQSNPLKRWAFTNSINTRAKPSS